MHNAEFRMSCGLKLYGFAKPLAIDSGNYKRCGILEVLRT
jgi:hypothetical protein